jgi:signal transduction histidine kinase
VELRKRLRGARRQSTRHAEALGRAAMSKGIETLDLARIHEQAVIALMPPDCSAAVRAVTMERAGGFFIDALAPIERTRRAMVDTVMELRISNDTLRLKAAELTSANEFLKQEIAQRAAAERSLRLSERRYRMLLAESRRMQQRLRHLSHQVLMAQEEERKEISRELHDEIVQTLTGINVHLARLKLESGASKESFSKHISYTQRLVEKSVDIVHQFARDLRPTLLDDLGLIPAIHAYLKAFTKRTGLRVRFSTFAGIESLSNDKRTVLYRVAQAALVNIAQHAEATSASLVITRMPGAVEMVIKDNGKSFNPVRVLDSRRNKRLGLIGMRERVEMVGGTFAVASTPGSGTAVSATLPYKHSANS